MGMQENASLSAQEETSTASDPQKNSYLADDTPHSLIML
jgi:hypothetical protein